MKSKTIIIVTMVLLCALLCCSNVAWCLEIMPNEPLVTTIKHAPANIHFLIDDSGSMDWEFMTSESNGLYSGKYYVYYEDGSGNYDNVDNNNSEIFVAGKNHWKPRYPGYNKLFYNPAVDYEPWKGKDANGNEFSNVNPESAPSDPYHPDQYPRNLTIRENASWWVWFDANSNKEFDANEMYKVVLSGSGSSTTVTYYQWDQDPDSYQEVDASHLHPVTSPPTSVQIIRTPQEELQNFANWYSYYRRREYVVKAAVGKIINQMSGVNIGLSAINDSFPFQDNIYVDSSTDGETNRSTLLSKLYAYKSHGGTPLRNGLNRVGKYLKGELTNHPSPLASEEDGGACQRNFAITMTDGYYNGSSPDVGNVDGGEKGDFGHPGYAGTSPYTDKYANTLADVAMKYWLEDLAPTLPDYIPDLPNDPATWQHMVTYTVAFGVTGTLDPNQDPNTVHWPNPFEGNAEKIDDLADRIEEMESEYELVMLRIQGLKLKKTKILVDVNPKNVVYGENFTICGRLLTEDNEPVSNATVKVSVGKSGYSTVTNISGFYSLKASVSEYKREVEVVAFYEPEKLESLGPCLNKTTVEVIFYDTKVLIETPPEAFPGLKAYVNISIEPFEGYRLVNLCFDGLKIANLEVEKPNATLFFEVPERASPGLHVVEVWVEPEGLYAPGYAQSSILVSLKSIDVHWEAPSFALYPFNKIYFSGFANYYNGTPLSSANVTLYRNGEAVATTLTDAIGFYRFEFYGFSWFPCSEADYELVVEPRQPWLEKYSYETRIIEMNLVTFIGSVLLLMAVARSKLPYRTYHMVKSLFKRRREPAKKFEKFSEHVPPLRQVIVKTLRSIEERVGKEKKRMVATAKYKGRIGLVQWIYFNVLVYFARKLSAIGKSETYREYFRRIALALEYKTKKLFLKLMLMAEAERYGGKKVEVEEANALAEEIIDELEG